MGLFDRSKLAQDRHKELLGVLRLLAEQLVKNGKPEDADRVRETLVRMGRIEGEVESLHMQWASYKDELKRLVQRLEKRDQRAAERAQAEQPDQDPYSHLDQVSQRILRRRNALRRHGSQTPG